MNCTVAYGPVAETLRSVSLMYATSSVVWDALRFTSELLPSEWFTNTSSFSTTTLDAVVSSVLRENL